MNSSFGSPQYIAALEFAYLETWCFERAKISDDFTRLSNLRMERHLNADERKRYAELSAESMEPEENIYLNGRLHPGAVKKNTFNSNDVQAARLKEILMTKVEHVNRWMCWPIYRDAVIFYNKNHDLVSVLSICFSCDDLKATGFGSLDADEKTYQLLRSFFTEIGHGLQENDPFT